MFDWGQLNSSVWVAVVAFVLTSVALFVHQTHVSKRLGKLRDELEANDEKLARLFSTVQQLNSSNGNSLRRRGE